MNLKSVLRAESLFSKSLPNKKDKSNNDVHNNVSKLESLTVLIENLSLQCPKTSQGIVFAFNELNSSPILDVDLFFKWYSKDLNMLRHIFDSSNGCSWYHPTADDIGKELQVECFDKLGFGLTKHVKTQIIEPDPELMANVENAIQLGIHKTCSNTTICILNGSNQTVNNFNNNITIINNNNTSENSNDLPKDIEEISKIEIQTDVEVRETGIFISMNDNFSENGLLLLPSWDIIISCVQPTSALITVPLPLPFYEMLPHSDLGTSYNVTTDTTTNDNISNSIDGIQATATTNTTTNNNNSSRQCLQWIGNPSGPLYHFFEPLLKYLSPSSTFNHDINDRKEKTDVIDNITTCYTSVKILIHFEHRMNRDVFVLTSKYLCTVPLSTVPEIRRHTLPWLDPKKNNNNYSNNNDIKMEILEYSTDPNNINLLHAVNTSTSIDSGGLNSSKIEEDMEDLNIIKKLTIENRILRNQLCELRLKLVEVGIEPIPPDPLYLDEIDSYQSSHSDYEQDSLKFLPTFTSTINTPPNNNITTRHHHYFNENTTNNKYIQELEQNSLTLLQQNKRLQHSYDLLKQTSKQQQFSLNTHQKLLEKYATQNQSLQSQFILIQNRLEYYDNKRNEYLQYLPLLLTYQNYPLQAIESKSLSDISQNHNAILQKELSQLQEELQAEKQLKLHVETQLQSFKNRMSDEFDALLTRKEKVDLQVLELTAKCETVDQLRDQIHDLISARNSELGNDTNTALMSTNHHENLSTTITTPPSSTPSSSTNNDIQRLRKWINKLLTERQNERKQFDKNNIELITLQQQIILNNIKLESYDQLKLQYAETQENLNEFIRKFNEKNEENNNLLNELQKVKNDLESYQIIIHQRQQQFSQFYENEKLLIQLQYELSEMKKKLTENLKPSVNPENKLMEELSKRIVELEVDNLNLKKHVQDLEEKIIHYQSSLSKMQINLNSFHSLQELLQSNSNHTGCSSPNSSPNNVVTPSLVSDPHLPNNSTSTTSPGITTIGHNNNKNNELDDVVSISEVYEPLDIDNNIDDSTSTWNLYSHQLPPPSTAYHPNHDHDLPPNLPSTALPPQYTSSSSSTTTTNNNNIKENRSIMLILTGEIGALQQLLTRERVENKRLSNLLLKYDRQLQLREVHSNRSSPVSFASPSQDLSDKTSNCCFVTPIVLKRRAVVPEVEEDNTFATQLTDHKYKSSKEINGVISHKVVYDKSSQTQMNGNLPSVVSAPPMTAPIPPSSASLQLSQLFSNNSIQDEEQIDTLYPLSATSGNSTASSTKSSIIKKTTITATAIANHPEIEEEEVDEDDDDEESSNTASSDDNNSDNSDNNSNEEDEDEEDDDEEDEDGGGGGEGEQDEEGDRTVKVKISKSTNKVIMEKGGYATVMNELQHLLRQNNRLKKEIVHQKKEASTLREVLEKTERERESLTSKWPQIMQKLQQMKESKIQAESAAKSSSTQLLSLGETNRLLECELIKVKTDNVQLKQLFNSIAIEKQETQNKHKSELDKLKSDLMNLKEHYHTLENKNSDYQQEIQILQNTIENLNSSNLELQQDLEVQLNQQQSNLTNHNNNNNSNDNNNNLLLSQEERSWLLSRCKDLETEIIRLRQLLSSYQDNNNTNNTPTSQHHHLQNKDKESNKDKDTLISEFVLTKNTLQCELEVLKKSFQELQQRSVTLEIEANKANKECVGLRKECSRLKDTITTVQRNKEPVIKMKADIELLEQKLTQSVTESTHQSKLLIEAQLTIETLQLEVNSYRDNKHSTLGHSRNNSSNNLGNFNNDSMNSNYNNYQQQQQQVLNHNDISIGSSNGSGRSGKQVSGNNDNQKQQIHQLRAQLLDANQATQAMNSLLSENTALIDKLTTEKEQLQHNLNSIANDLTTTHTQLQQANLQLQELDTLNKRIDKEKNGLRKECTRLKDSIAKAQEDRDALKKLKPMYKELETKCTSMEALILELENQIKKCLEEIVTRDNTITQLDSQVADLDVVLIRTLQFSDFIGMEMEDLRYLGLRLKDELQYAEKIINKLKDELKIAQTADPLIVQDLTYKLADIVGVKNHWENKARSLSKDLQRRLLAGTPLQRELGRLTGRLEEVENERNAYRDAMVMACEAYSAKNAIPSWFG